MRSCFLAGASEQGAVYGCKWNLESLAVLLPCTELHGGSAKGKVARQNPTLHNGDIIEHGTPCRRFSAGSIIPIMIKLAGPDRPRVLAARCPVPTPASKARRKLFMHIAALPECVRRSLPEPNRRRGNAVLCHSTTAEQLPVIRRVRS